jgi:hypothetical protein
VSLWRRNARKDDNHSAIVEVLRQAGASVVSLNAPGCPDLLVGFVAPDGTRRNVLVEVKRPAGKRGGTSNRKLNPAQEIFHRTWRGDRPWVVRSPAEALAVVGYCPESEPNEPTSTFPGQDPEAAGVR